MIIDISETKCTIRWEPSEDDGGADVKHYIVEYFRDVWEVWLKAKTTKETQVEGYYFYTQKYANIRKRTQKYFYTQTYANGHAKVLLYANAKCTFIRRSTFIRKLSLIHQGTL